MKTPREEQIETLRNTANNLRDTAKQARKEAAGWQDMADQTREKADRDEEHARIWALLADALDGGQLDNIVVPLGAGRDDRATTARIHALQGRLMAELPNLDAWGIHCGELTAMLHKSVSGSRRAILAIAERYGIGYAEDNRGKQIYVAAEGEIDDVPVKIWCLLPVEHMDYAEAEAVREIERETAIEAGDDSELAQQVAEDDVRHERIAALAALAALDALDARDAASAVWFDVMSDDVESGT